MTELDGLHEAMEFRFVWRKYQRMGLDLFDDGPEKESG